MTVSTARRAHERPAHRSAPVSGDPSPLAFLSSRRGVLTGLGAVLAVQLGVNLYLLSRAYFSAEDFMFFGLFEGVPFGEDLLTRPIFGHLIPGFILVNRYYGSALGANWTVACLVTLAIQAGGTIALARLLHALRGMQWWLPWVTGAYALSVITLNTTPWWAAILTMQITVVCSIATWGCAVRWDNTRRLRHLVGLLVMFALAVSFFEKAIAVPVYLGLFVLIVGTRDTTEGWGARLRRAVGLWPVWTILAAVCLLDLAVYFRGDYLDTAGEPAGLAITAEYLVRNFAEGLFPALLGVIHPLVDLPGPAVLTPVVATAVTLAVIVWTSLRSGLARRAWVWFLISTVLSQLLVARGRLGIVEIDVVIANLRYQVDASYLFLIALAVAMPAAVATVGTRSRARLVVVAALLPLLFVPGWLRSVQAIPTISFAENSRTYFHDLRTEDLPAGARFLDLPVPEWVVQSNIAPWNSAAKVFPLVRPGTEVTTDPDDALQIRWDGSIAPVSLTPLAVAGLEAPGGCLRRSDPALTVLTVPATPPADPALPVVVVIPYTAAGPADLTLTATGTAGPVTLRDSIADPISVPRGSGTIAVPVIAPDWQELSIDLGGRGELCTSGVYLAVPGT